MVLEKYKSDIDDMVHFAIRHALSETGIDRLPVSTILIVPYWEHTSYLNRMFDLDIFVTGSIGGDEIKLAFNSNEIKYYSLLKAFEEGLILYE